MGPKPEDLLLELFKRPSPTGQEKILSSYIQELLVSWGVEFEIDPVGNLFQLSHPGQPLLTAHLDTVQSPEDCALVDKIHLDEEFIHPITAQKRRVIRGDGVIGADDKAGVYLLLELLRRSYRFNFVLTVSEENRSSGMRYFCYRQDPSGLPFALVLDMWGSQNIVCAQRGYASRSFEKALLALDPEWSTHSGFESDSDAQILAKYLPCANLSVGYHKPHKKNEYLDLEDLAVSLEFVQKILGQIRSLSRSAEP